jgi:translocator protein
MGNLLDREFGRGQSFAMAAGIMVVLAILGTLLAGGGLGPWYQSLTKPPWLVSIDVFFLVAIIYYIIGITLLTWLLRRRATEERAAALTLTFGMLLANEIWNGLFLGLESVLMGLLGMVAFAAITWGLQYTLWRFEFRREATLLLPYSVWVAYNLAWAFELWRLNS